MKALIITFSGTGNTRSAGNMIGNALCNLGYKVDYAKIHLPADDIPNTAEYDLIGYGYPIHAFNAPSITLKYARLLPKVDGINTFLFKTSGEPFAPNNASSFQLYRILTKKGYKIMSDTHMLMPYNIMFRYNDSLAKQMYLHTNAMSKLIALKAANGETTKIHYNFFAKVFALILRLQWFGAWINGPMIHVKKDKCIACGKCVRDCPTDNVRIEDGIARFSGKCTMCMGCVMGCPVDAVRPGFLNPWRVNGYYNFKEVLADDAVADKYVKEGTKGYFKLFKKYYERTYKELQERGIELENPKTLSDYVQGNLFNVVMRDGEITPQEAN